jgi:hypothetical protein
VKSHDEKESGNISEVLKCVSGVFLAGLHKAVLQEAELLSYFVCRPAIANWLPRSGPSAPSWLCYEADSLLAKFREPHWLPHSGQQKPRAGSSEPFRRIRNPGPPLPDSGMPRLHHGLGPVFESFVHSRVPRSRSAETRTCIPVPRMNNCTHAPPMFRWCMCTIIYPWDQVNPVRLATLGFSYRYVW